MKKFQILSTLLVLTLCACTQPINGTLTVHDPLQPDRAYIEIQTDDGPVRLTSGPYTIEINSGNIINTPHIRITNEFEVDLELQLSLPEDQVLNPQHFFIPGRFMNQDFDLEGATSYSEPTQFRQDYWQSCWRWDNSTGRQHVIEKVEKIVETLDTRFLENSLPVADFKGTYNHYRIIDRFWGPCLYF